MSFEPISNVPLGNSMSVHGSLFDLAQSRMGFLCLPLSFCPMIIAIMHLQKTPASFWQTCNKRLASFRNVVIGFQGIVSFVALRCVVCGCYKFVMCFRARKVLHVPFFVVLIIVGFISG